MENLQDTIRERKERNKHCIYIPREVQLEINELYSIFPILNNDFIDVTEI